MREAAGRIAAAGCDGGRDSDGPRLSLQNRPDAARGIDHSRSSPRGANELPGPGFDGPVLARPGSVNLLAGVPTIHALVVQMHHEIGAIRR